MRALAAIEVFRDPDAAAGAYRETRVVHRGETVTAVTIPGVLVEVDALFS